MSAYFTLIFIYLLKVNKTWNLFKVSIKDSSKRWRRFGIFIADFEQIEHLVLVILLLNLNRYMQVESLQIKFFKIWEGISSLVVFL